MNLTRVPLPVDRSRRVARGAVPLWLGNTVVHVDARVYAHYVRLISPDRHNNKNVQYYHEYYRAVVRGNAPVGLVRARQVKRHKETGARVSTRCPTCFFLIIIIIIYNIIIYVRTSDGIPVSLYSAAGRTVSCTTAAMAAVDKKKKEKKRRMELLLFHSTLDTFFREKKIPFQTILSPTRDTLNKRQ